MKKTILLFICLLLSIPVANAEDAENPLFGYTHMMSSPLTLPAGKLVIGTETAFGITGFLQVGTNVFTDFFKIYNANAKLGILDFSDFALALTLGYQSYNYSDIFPGNPNIQVTSWLPGAVTAFAILPDVALFVGGNLNFSSANILVDTVQTSGFLQGASGESDISWAYNRKKRHVGNVLSAGVTYDFTYKIYGVGISHHWPGLHLGIHYYPSAPQYQLYPILAGGASVDF